MASIWSETRIAKGLLYLSIIFNCIFIVVGLAVGTLTVLGGLNFTSFSSGGALLFTLAKVVGVALVILALQKVGRNDLRAAGIFALVASVVPPLDLLALFGGLTFFFLSRELNVEPNATA